MKPKVLVIGDYTRFKYHQLPNMDRVMQSLLGDEMDVLCTEDYGELRAERMPASALAIAHERLDEVVAGRLAAVGDGRGYINAARAMAALHGAPLTPRLADIRTHVDVVAATADTFCPPKASAIITHALADVTYHEIPGAGHLMNVDAPGAVTGVLRTTLIGRT